MQNVTAVQIRKQRHRHKANRTQTEPQGPRLERLNLNAAQQQLV